MRKYREYSDSELREKFPEVADSTYDKYKYKTGLLLGTPIRDTTTGKRLETMEEIEEITLKSKIIGKP